MKVGLVRHFKVLKGYPEKRLVTPDEVARWFDEYDVADIEPGEVDLQGIAWKRCYASDLPRAIRTAEMIYPGEIIKTERLREIPAYPIYQRNIPLPFMVWAVLVRAAWLFRHRSQKESYAMVKQRLEMILDEILASQEDVLIVSHAALMMVLRRELIRRGFTGPAFGTAGNGKLYLFEN